MSHKPPYPEAMREELYKFFAHVQQRDPKDLKFALMVTGHGEANGSTHVRSMLGGPPQTLAIVIMELMDELVNRDPAFVAFFLLSFLQRMHNRQNIDVEIVDLDSPVSADVEEQVKDLLDKLRKNTSPDGNIH